MANIETQFKNHTHNGADSPRIRLVDVEFPVSDAIPDPDGGTNIDTEARDAIEAIIDALETVGIITQS